MDDGRKADIHQRITKNLPDFMAQVSKNEKNVLKTTGNMAGTLE